MVTLFARLQTCASVKAFPNALTQCSLILSLQLSLALERALDVGQIETGLTDMLCRERDA